MNAPALEFRRVSYEAANHRIVDDVSFAVERGQYVSLIGPNGAGKTTLMRLTNRILDRTNGDVLILGKPQDSYTQRQLGRALSYVPQTDTQTGLFTVREFVLMGRYPQIGAFSGYSRRDHEQVDEALELTATAMFADRKLHSLSGGEKQKVYIAAALAQEAEILLVDEPTAHLDYKHQVEVIDSLQRLRASSDLTVVSVTHELSHGVTSSDLVIALKNGELVFSGSPQQLLEAKTLEEIYDTTFDIIKNPRTGAPIIVPVGGP